MNTTLTAVAGLEVGHSTDQDNATGCTAILCRQGAVGGVDVRGGSPGTRETDLLRPMHRVERIHGIVLSGGSAFGLDAASGVMQYLEAEGIGFRAGPTIVPIVSSAILFDLGLITGKVRPGPTEGFAAATAANSKPVSEGSVGAGTGATVGKALGLERATKGGLGCSAMKLSGGFTVAALVVVNAYGDVVDYTSGRLIAGPRSESEPGSEQESRSSLVNTVEWLTQGDPGDRRDAGATSGDDDTGIANTTIGVVATDASLTREEANFLAQVSHDGLALAIRPCHTIRDGDTMFALATGQNVGPDAGRVDLTLLGAAAVEVTAQAVLRAISTATGLGGIPASSELTHG